MGTPADVANPSDWAEFGLAGLVILSLFIALFIIVKWLINHIDRQSQTHASERKEWRESSERVSREMVGQMKENAEQVTSQLKEDTTRMEKAVDQLASSLQRLTQK